MWAKCSTISRLVSCTSFDTLTSDFGDFTFCSSNFSSKLIAEKLIILSDFEIGSDGWKAFSFRLWECLWKVFSWLAFLLNILRFS